jgi:HAD superfamily hydrolase (TIGR01509 family)
VPQDAYLNQIDQWYMDHVDQINIRPYVLEALQYFKAQNIPQAVVSNGRQRSVMAALKAKNLTPFFEFILCKEDYEGRKPEPTPYLTALEKMRDIRREDIKATDCLVVEDDPLGVEAGTAAGMQVYHRAPDDDHRFRFLE